MFKHKPVSDLRLRVKWVPIYMANGEETQDPTGDPCTEEVPFNRILHTVQMHSGIMAHSIARKLDVAGYRLDKEELDGSGYETKNLEPSDQIAVVLEELAQVTQMDFEVGSTQKSKVRFETNHDFQRWIRLKRVDFAEVYRGYGEATIRVAETGLCVAEGFDKLAVTYERAWQLEDPGDRADFAWLITRVLRPTVVHLGTPCTDMSVAGRKEIGDETQARNELSEMILDHQESSGLFCSEENPKGSQLWKIRKEKYDEPKWRYFKLDGCQFNATYPGEMKKGAPTLKGTVWLSNMDLGPMELRCRHPCSLQGATHVHEHLRGRDTVDGIRGVPIVEASGKYTKEQAAVYAMCVKNAVDSLPEDPVDENKSTRLYELGKDSQTAKIPKGHSAAGLRTSGEAPKASPAAFLITGSGGVLSLDKDEEEEPLAWSCGATRTQAKPSLRPATMTERADDRTKTREVDEESKKALEKEKEARAMEDQLAKEAIEAEKYWKEVADRLSWDEVVADLEVYRFCGQKVEKDPRRNDEYRQKVLEVLKLSKYGDRTELTAAEYAAIKEVISRKIAAFWIEGTPRTTLRHLMHDTIPTGPPVRTPPHNLKGEEAEWVDKQLQSEVETGQLERGNSEWASPPFATKDFAAHKRQRKRRLVVDYRRVNQRTLRAIYFVRSADGVVAAVAGSAWMTFLDACKGFNQIVNTERARRMLAILARSGQFLPRCLTFGPHNGPEDFAFATDRVFSPGRNRKMRLCK